MESDVPFFIVLQILTPYVYVEHFFLPAIEPIQIECNAGFVYVIVLWAYANFSKYSELRWQSELNNNKSHSVHVKLLKAGRGKRVWFGAKTKTSKTKWILLYRRTSCRFIMQSDMFVSFPKTFPQQPAPPSGNTQAKYARQLGQNGNVPKFFLVRWPLFIWSLRLRSLFSFDVNNHSY